MDDCKLHNNFSARVMNNTNGDVKTSKESTIVQQSINKGNIERKRIQRKLINVTKEQNERKQERCVE